jgi:hypothetical protein
MENSMDLKALQQKAYRYDAQDGLLEFLMGVMLFFVARAVVTPHLAWLPALLIFPMRWALKFFKERFTYPRIGYVKLRTDEETPREFGMGILRYLAVIVLIIGVGLLAFGEVGSWQYWMKWMPAIMGGFCSGGFLYAAQKSGFKRHYFLFLVSIGWGIACSFMNTTTVYHGISRWALGLGLLCLVMGVVIFLNFIRNNPVRPQEVNDVQA